MKTRKRGPETVTPNVWWTDHWRWWGWAHKKGGAWWATAWTTKKSTKGPHPGEYVAVLFKWDPKARWWAVSKTAGRAARWRVKDLSYRWYCEKSGTQFKSLHKKREVTGVQRFQWHVRQAARRGRDV